jgi:hypothetical protein
VRLEVSLSQTVNISKQTNLAAFISAKPDHRTTAGNAWAAWVNVFMQKTPQYLLQVAFQWQHIFHMKAHSLKHWYVTSDVIC